jgi:hypothetical protein
MQWKQLGKSEPVCALTGCSADVKEGQHIALSPGGGSQRLLQQETACRHKVLQWGN